MSTAKPRRSVERTLPALSQSEPLPIIPGQRIAGKYEITRLLGTGGIGFVVAATHIQMGEQVAIKFLRRQMLKSPDIVGRFAQEARATARLKSEHVPCIYDVGSLPDGLPFIVMEYLEGRDLFTLLEDEGPQPCERAVDFVLQACEALADAHTCGIVHRDIKPDNLFLARRSPGVELIKVLDFGISRVALTGSFIDGRFSPVKTVLPVGTPMYMSPEQIRAAHDIDHRTDIWSLGCVLYELLSGYPVFNAAAITQVSSRILEQDPEPPRTSIRLPPGLQACIMRCLEKDPKRRFQDVAELALALCPFGSRWARVSAERCYLLLHTKHPPSLLDTMLPKSGIRLLGKALGARGRSGGKKASPAKPTGNLHTDPLAPVMHAPANMRPWGALGFAAVAFLSAGLGWILRPAPQPFKPQPDSTPTRVLESVSPDGPESSEGASPTGTLRDAIDPRGRSRPAAPRAAAAPVPGEKAPARAQVPDNPRAPRFPYRWRISPAHSPDPDPGF